MPHQTILLTGITGFIAKRIAADLLAAGHHVVGSLRSPSRADEVRAAVAPFVAGDAGDRLRFVTLDLTSDDGWVDAMAGVDALVHTASPFPMAQPRDADTLIRPAVDGTLRALRAAHAAHVTRVVLTSSMVAVMHTGTGDGVRGPGDWTDPDSPVTTAYDRSKTLAERAAWDFADAHPAMALTTVNPGLVAGRPLDRHYGTSLQLIERFLSGKDPAVPNFGLPIVDVADVSALHLAAPDNPDTTGHRLLAAERFMMAPEIAALLARAYPDRRIATRVAPTWLLRALSVVDPSVRSVLPRIGLRLDVDTAEARRLTGIAFRSAEEAILDSAAFIARKTAA